METESETDGIRPRQATPDADMLEPKQAMLCEGSELSDLMKSGAGRKTPSLAQPKVDMVKSQRARACETVGEPECV